VPSGGDVWGGAGEPAVPRSPPRWQMRSSPQPASAFARCRSWIPISVDRHRPPGDKAWSGHLLRGERRDDRFKGGSFCALLLLCAGEHHAPPTPSAFSSDGNPGAAADCVACHRFPGGKAFAGGLKMGTPLGAFTRQYHPGQGDGIGSYEILPILSAPCGRESPRTSPPLSGDALSVLLQTFRRGRGGALPRFFMKQVPPVRQANLNSQIPALLGFRWPLAMWNYFFAPKCQLCREPGHDAAWIAAPIWSRAPAFAAPVIPPAHRYPGKVADDSSPNYLAGAELDAWYAPSLRATCGPVSVIGRKRTSSISQKRPSPHRHRVDR